MPAKEQAEYASDLFAELAVHDSREGIKRVLAATRSLLGLAIDYESPESAGDLVEPRPPGGVAFPMRAANGRVHGVLMCSSAEGAPLDRRDARFLALLAGVIADQLELEQEGLERVRAHGELVGRRALLAAIEARDSYTGKHSRSVVALARQVAAHLELAPRFAAQVEQVALLHDVGKIAVPDGILNKPGPLDEREWEIMRGHATVGARMVRSIRGLSHLAIAIRAEHERFDGRGYPDGLLGEQIPIVSRITLVCDAYHAMTSERPYRHALSHAVAVEELRRHRGSQFCPRCVDALLAVLGERVAPGAPA